MERNRGVSGAIPSKNAAGRQTLSARLVRQGRQRAQIGDQRIEVLRLELAGGGLHHFSHRLGEDIPLGGPWGGRGGSLRRLPPPLSVPPRAGAGARALSPPSR